MKVIWGDGHLQESFFFWMENGLWCEVICWGLYMVFCGRTWVGMEEDEMIWKYMHGHAMMRNMSISSNDWLWQYWYLIHPCRIPEIYCIFKRQIQFWLGIKVHYAQSKEKHSMTKSKWERWGENDFAGDKFLIQKMMKIPSNGREDLKSWWKSLATAGKVWTQRWQSLETVGKVKFCGDSP